jgi:hypothetical protein
VQLQTQVAGQLKPQRHLLFLPGGGHLPGKLEQDLLPEAQLKKLLLVGFPNDLDLVELSLPKGLQNPLLVMFNDLQVHGVPSGQRTILSSAMRSASASTCVWRLASNARSR